MINVVDVQPLRCYRLRLTFSNGITGDADLWETIRSFEPFAPLRDPELFAQAHVDGGTVAWPGELDIAAERLYALVHGQPLHRYDANDTDDGIGR